MSRKTSRDPLVEDDSEVTLLFVLERAVLNEAVAVLKVAKSAFALRTMLRKIVKETSDPS